MTPDKGPSDTFLRHIVGGPFSTRMPRHVGAAVSGGSDSMAMLDLLRHWCAEHGIQLSAVTIDHGLRVEAKDEAAFVARHCAEAGIAHEIITWGGWDGTGNLQAVARDARYRLLAEWAQEHEIDSVAVGHTSNDLAETFLMRLARAAGVDGLAAMDRRFQRDGMWFSRPVLQISRQDLRDYLIRHEMSWIDDPSNNDRRFDRVKAREALVHLEPLGITEKTLRTTAHNLRMAAGALDRFTQVEAENYVAQEEGDLLLTLGKNLHLEIARRLKLAALRYVGGEPYPPRGASLGDLDLGLHKAGKHTLAGCVITRDDKILRFTRELNAVAGITSDTDQIWDGRWHLKGPHASDLQVRALGEAGLANCPAWRESGLPRISLLSSPSIWRGDALVAAPLAGLAGEWSAEAVKFSTFLATTDGKI